MDSGELILFAAKVIFTLVGCAFILNLVGVWLKARFSGAPVTFLELIALMNGRNNVTKSGSAAIPVRRIVNPRIMLFKAGFNVSVKDLVHHYQNCGRLNFVALAMIMAKEKKAELSFDQACTMDWKDIEDLTKKGFSTRAYLRDDQTRTKKELEELVAKLTQSTT